MHDAPGRARRTSSALGLVLTRGAVAPRYTDLPLTCCAARATRVRDEDAAFAAGVCAHERVPPVYSFLCPSPEQRMCPLWEPDAQDH